MRQHSGVSVPASVGCRQCDDLMEEIRQLTAENAVLRAQLCQAAPLQRGHVCPRCGTPVMPLVYPESGAA